MESVLESLFGLASGEGTLSYLIYQACKDFGNQPCLAVENTCVTYARLDCMSDNVAAFLTGDGYAENYVLCLALDGTAESAVVLLAAIKAGITITEPEGLQIETIGSNLFKKSILNYTGGFFDDGLTKTGFSDALQKGEGYAFFNIPANQAADVVFVSAVPIVSGETAVCNRAALGMIADISLQEDVNPFIAFLYSFTNNWAIHRPAVRI